MLEKGFERNTSMDIGNTREIKGKTKDSNTIGNE